MDPRDATNRDLLIGLLALQTGLVDQAALVAAFHAWSRDKRRPMTEILLAQKALDGDERAALEALAAKHLKRHEGDAEKSLAALTSRGLPHEVVNALEHSATERNSARLRSISAGDSRFATQGGADLDSNATVSYSGGAATSDGRRFRVLRPHAKGALGVVSVALDEELHREVALKEIQASHADDPESRARFVIEAEITGGLEHPGIVPVYGLGTYADGRPYYAMRFIRGDNLKQAITSFHRHDGPSCDSGADSLALRKLLRRFVDVCNAVDYAHGRGVVHRDLKPGNVILGKHGETLVVDWGLAKAVGRAEQRSDTGERTLKPASASGSSETLPGSALGTPAYMSPEQASGDLDRLGPRSDVYSLGATLYCLLTGRPPFEGQDVGAMLCDVQKGEFPSPRQVNPSLSAALEAVCLKAMTLSQEDRYGSAKELADDVERWMADEPVLARREPFAERTRRWMRKQRTAVTAAAAAVLVALLGTTAVLVVQTRANADLKAANRLLAAAHDRELKANGDLSASNDRERARFALAMDAIKLFHGEVSEDSQLQQLQFEGLRTKLLRDAAGFYAKLEDLLRGEADRPSRAALGRAYAELADLTGKIGEKSEALALYHQAIEVQRELAADPDADAGSWLQLAQSLLNVGSLRIGTEDLPGALAAFEEVESIVEGLSATDRNANPARAILGTSHHRTGMSRALMGEPVAAQRAYRQALEIREALAEANPFVNQYQNELAQTSNNLGLVKRAEGDPTAALRLFQRTLEIEQKLADAHPTDSLHQSYMGAAHGNIGLVLRDLGDRAGAVRSHRLAMEIQKKLVKLNPSIARFKRDLGNTHNDLGDDLRATGSMSEARDLYTDACAIFERLIGSDALDAEYRYLLIQSLRGLGATRQAAGEIAEAAASWRKAIEIGDRTTTTNAENLAYPVGCHARLAGIAGMPGSGLSAEEGVAERDRAMDCLRRVIGAGYHPAGWLQHDQDLDSLRSLPAFQALTMDSAFPAQVFAP